MTNPTKCPKCEGPMVQGYIPDFFHHSASGVGGWQEGPPKKSIWKGTKASLSGGVPIGAFRCKGCGFLEFYANPEFAAS
jgi:hypothetical protein